MSNYKKIIEKTRIRFFRRDVGLQFFGILAYKFKWEIEDLPMTAEGYVAFSKDKDLNLADGRIHINKNFVDQPDYTHHNLIFLICHELLHILKKHGIRRQNRDELIWNFAGDHVIDRELKGLNLTPYRNNYNIIKELHQLNPKCTTEEAYDWIKKQQDNFNKRFKFDIDKDGNITVTDTKTGEKYQVKPIPGSPSSPDDKLTIQQVNQFIAEANSMFQLLDQKGNISGNMKEYIKNLLKVEIPWEKIIEKAIKTNFIQKPIERSWRRFNNFYIPHNLNLPGYALGEEDENVGILIIGFDSSGSISKKLIRKFSYIIDESFHYFKEIILIVHDVEIHQIKTFYQDDKIEFQNFITNVGIKGRGGTSHKYLFNYIENEIWSKRDKRDNLSMVMSLTDGESDIEQIYKQYNWIINNTPLLFILPPKSKWSFNTNGYDNIQFIKMQNN